MIDAPTDRFYRAKSPDGRRVVCKVDAGIGTTPILGTILGEVDTVVARRARERLFQGEKFLRPLDLDNLSRREIPKFIDGAWFGWHAFRRVLGTRLNAAGVNNKDHPIDFAPR